MEERKNRKERINTRYRVDGSIRLLVCYVISDLGFDLWVSRAQNTL